MPNRPVLDAPVGHVMLPCRWSATGLVSRCVMF